MSVFELEDLDIASLERLQRCAAAGPPGGPLLLDLRLSGPVDPHQGALFTGALMAELGDVQLEVSHPDPAPRAEVFRSGLAAALSWRGEATTFADPASPLSDPELGATWTRGMAHFREALFGEGEGEGLFGPDHAVFLNPHRTTSPPGPASITRVVRRWLGRRLGRAASERLGDIAFALDQLIVNVTEHAVTELTPTVGSLARVEIESGEEGRPRALVAVVLDTGAGIATTLRRKLGDAPPDPELLTALLEGSLPQWGRARGIGLSRLTQAVQEAGGSMHLAVEGTGVDVGARVRAAPTSVPVRGSIVSLRLPL